MPQPRRRHVQRTAARFRQRLAHHRQMADLVGPEQAGAHAVVEVVAVIGDVVGDGGDLRLRRGLRAELQIVQLGVGLDVGRRLRSAGRYA